MCWVDRQFIQSNLNGAHLQQNLRVQSLSKMKAGGSFKLNLKLWKTSSTNTCLLFFNPVLFATIDTSSYPEYYLFWRNGLEIVLSFSKENIGVSNSILSKTRLAVSFASLKEEMELSGNILYQNTLLSHLSSLHGVL